MSTLDTFEGIRRCFFLTTFLLCVQSIMLCDQAFNVV